MYSLIKFVAEGRLEKAHDFMFKHVKYFCDLYSIYERLSVIKPAKEQLENYKAVRALAKKLLNEASEVKPCIDSELGNLSKMSFSENSYIYLGHIMPATQDVTEFMNKKFIRALQFLYTLGEKDDWEDIEAMQDEATKIVTMIDPRSPVIRKKSCTWKECAADLVTMYNNKEINAGLVEKIRSKMAESPKTQGDIVWRYYIKRILSEDDGEAIEDVMAML
ncbi:hypothetical protein BNJ_00369 [Kaumoebavirus]|uniref:hypothetical protein n=1 Tax=Kaumoebavirus TaxID=1859492 RepID=UPI0009C2BF7A|nr:hypothetical protein BNJ_00369 [Kaumoebavirus]ARA72189.1 hypothetical protein BNJ_00369 [Kaumoebavirus]